MVRVVSTSPVGDTDADLGESYTDTAGCPAGKVAFGGGGSIVEVSSDAAIVEVSSYPSSATVWTFKAEVVTDNDGKHRDNSDGVTVTAYVLCGKP
jgi:hypothetical protein